MAAGLRATIARRREAEIGAVVKGPGGNLRVCLVYPNIYHLGMSSLGFQTVYHLLNAEPGVMAERAFLPEEEDLAELLRTQGELVSYESQSPLQNFDVVAFSLSYELDYANVARILRLAKLPPFAADREQHHPLLLAGGPLASINPEPLADLLDLFLVGEAEPVLSQLCTALQEVTRDRAAALAAAAAVPGVYVPSRHSPTDPPVVRQYAPNLAACPTHSRVLTPETEFGELFLIEVSRGCARRCRFCVTPACYWPLRFRSAASVLATVDLGLEHRSAIGLIGAAVSDHPEIEEIATGIVARGARLSLSSLRADSVTPTLLGAMVQGGARSLTLAPEAGSEALRMAIGKGITDGQVVGALAMAKQAGLVEAKLYYMIGLPGEGEEDVAAIPALARRCLQEVGLRRLTIAAGAFVPKPGTPYQAEAMLPVAELSRRLRSIRDALRGDRRITLALESANWSYLEGALSRGDRRLGAVIVAAADAGGNLSAWRSAFAAADLTPEQFAGGAPPNPPPWAVVNS